MQPLTCPLPAPHDTALRCEIFDSTLTQSSTQSSCISFLLGPTSTRSFLVLFGDWNVLAMDPLFFHAVDAFKNYLFTDPSSHHFHFLAILFFIRRKRRLPSRCAFAFSNKSHSQRKMKCLNLFSVDPVNDLHSAILG